MTSFTPFRVLVATALLTLSAAALPACPGPEPEGADLFRLAVNGAPGGSLLSVWGPRAYAGSLWLAGGFVGVDPARLTGTGMSAGRLVEYTSGRFTTRCRANAVLWWAHGVERNGATPEVWAVGEGGTVLRYRDGACETLPLGITFAEGPPTFWGVWAESPTDVYLVGGSALPTGPKGVLVHYDGASFTRITALPEAARGENLYKITRAASRYLVVGSGGTLLRVGDRGAEVTALSAPINSSDNRMFTVSCFGASCFAVGGVASGFVLRGSPGANVFPRLESLTGLSTSTASTCRTPRTSSSSAPTGSPRTSRRAASRGPTRRPTSRARSRRRRSTASAGATRSPSRWAASSTSGPRCSGR